jgi:uncharacterized membrane protein (DUF485 family)
MSEDSRPGAGAASRNARIGLVLFLIYLAFYGGFMGLTTFDFNSLRTSFGGVNLAIIYGIGLIVAALLLALLYMVMCHAEGTHPTDQDIERAVVEEDIEQKEEGQA